MAKVKFGAIVTDMRNKLGSSVFSRNRYGPYSRSFKVNVPSTTPAQATTKARLASFSTAWKALAQVQRDSWNDSVAAFKDTDVFGSVKMPSGFDLFVKLNCNLDQIGESSLSLPPVPQPIVFLSSLSVAFTTIGPSGILTFFPAIVPTGYKYVIMATACISPGISYVKNRLRQIAVIDAGDSSPVDIYAAYIAKFVSITSGMRISVQVISVNKKTGQKSPGLSATTIVDGLSGLDYDETLDGGLALT